MLAASLLAWPALHLGCNGGSTGVENPGVAELPVEFRDAGGNPVLVRGGLEIYLQDHNPALDTAPMFRRQVSDGAALRLTAVDFDPTLAGLARKRDAATKRSAAAAPPASDSLIRFNLVFRDASGSGALAAGLAYDPVRRKFFPEDGAMMEGGAQAAVRMQPKPLLRFAGSLRREAAHGVLGRIVLPGTPFQATLADSDFVLEGLTEGRFPMRLLDGDGYLYAVRESLDTHAGHAFTAAPEPIGRVDGINPPAGFGVEAGMPMSIYAGQDAQVQGQLLGADTNDSRVSILWRFLDKASGDTVRFSDPTRLRTVIRYPAIPAYSLELAATFGAFTVRDTLFIKVLPPLEPGMMKFIDPQPGDTLVQNQPYKVKWGYVAADLARLEVSYKGGDNWTMIADSLVNFSGEGGFEWTPPSLGGTSSDCLLRLKAIPSDSVLGVMPGPFVLVPGP